MDLFPPAQHVAVRYYQFRYGRAYRTIAILVRMQHVRLHAANKPFEVIHRSRDAGGRVLHPFQREIRSVILEATESPHPDQLVIFGQLSEANQAHSMSTSNQPTH